MNLFDPTIKPDEARRRLENLTVDAAVEPEDLEAAKALLASHERLERIADQAAEVRVRQREYFKGRQDSALQASKEAERRLDKMLNDGA